EECSTSAPKSVFAKTVQIGTMLGVIIRQKYDCEFFGRRCRFVENGQEHKVTPAQSSCYFEPAILGELLLCMPLCREIVADHVNRLSCGELELTSRLGSQGLKCRTGER